MRRSALPVAAAVLLALPVALAPFDGGYGEVPRIVAGLVAWALVLAAALLAPVPLPRGGAARLALGGLAGLAVLTALSIAWAPQAAPAFGDAQRLALYLGAGVAGVALLRHAGRWVEPAIAATCSAVVLTGLSERLVPALVELAPSASAGGRLEQPLGYWNAMGAVAAIGLALCAGLAADRSRDARLRAAAAAAAPVLGAGAVLSFSRGALLAAAAGLLAVVLSRATRPALRTVALLGGAAALGGLAAAALPAVADLEAPMADRRGEGAILALVLAVLAGGAAYARPRAAGGPGAALPRGLVRRAALAAVAAVIGGGALLVAADRGPRTGTPGFGATPARLGTVESNRYAYWRVAAGTRARHPLAGAGAFAVEWLRERPVTEGARDAHSLPIETAAELGLLGLAALLALIAGVVRAGVALQRAAPGAWAAAFGGLAAWSVHALLDWAWEIPSVSLLALLPAAALLAAADPEPAP